MTHPDPLQLLRHALQASHASQSANLPTPECLDDDTVAALAEGGLDAEARAAVLPHLVHCARCRLAVASVARALADARVAREVAGVKGGGQRHFRRIVLPAVAAAVLLVMVWSRPAGDGGTVHRAPTITATAEPAPMSPLGAVARPEFLRWAALAGAERYRVTLFDAGSRVLYETELADTVAVLPDSVVLVPGRPYLWKVEARTGWDRWASSKLVEFRVAGGAPR